MTYRRVFIFLSILLFVTILWWWYLHQTSRVYSPNHISQEEVTDNADNPVRVVFLDIGQGDATFFEWPDKTQMLVDCAKDARILEALGRVMPFHDRTIDYLIVTHPDLDHYGGCIDVLKRFDVQHIIFDGYKKEHSAMLESFLDATSAEKAEYVVIDRPQVWNIGSTTIHFLYPDHRIETDPNIPGAKKNTGSNNASIVFTVSYGDMDLLMTGDAESELESYLLQIYGDELDVEVLKAGHHGSSGATSQSWVDTVTPDVTIFSAGKGNSYGHPSLRIIRRVERAGSAVWRTDEDGDISMRLYKDRFLIDNTEQ